MEYTEIIAQCFGILGLILAVLSYQEKNNKRYFIEQGLTGLMFFINFILIGAFSAALFNITNLLRGVMLVKKKRKLCDLIFLEILYTACFGFSVYLIINKPFQIFLSALTYLSILVMSVVMWKGDGKNIRYCQLFISSPAWIIHNIFNFSLGGILCEVFMMISVVVSFIRFGKNGFEK